MKKDIEIVNPVLRAPAKNGIVPVWNENCRVLMIGSITSVDGMKIGYLYGSRHNQFWQLLDYCLGIDSTTSDSFSFLKKLLIENYKNSITASQFEENKKRIREQFRRRLLEHHVAMCDIFEECYFNGTGSADIDIILNNDDYPCKTYKDLLTEIIEKAQIETVIVNSDFVEKLFLAMNIPGDYEVKKVITPVQRCKTLEEKQHNWSEAFNGTSLNK